MSKKLVTCKECGEEFSKKCKKCPKCGAKNKKPFYKKVWFWLIVLIVLGSLGGKSETEAEPISTTPPTIQAPTTEPATEPATEPVAEEETTSRESLVDMWKMMVEMSAYGNYDYCEVSADETGAIVYLASNGFAEAVATLKAYGLDDTHEDWQTARNSLVALNKIFYEGAEGLGLDDFPVMLILVNDLNHDDMLLVIRNDEVAFDCMAN